MVVMLSKVVVITLFVATKNRYFKPKLFSKPKQSVFLMPKTNQTISTGLMQHEMEY